MAYINKDEIKVIRNELKKEFPGFKFSVRSASGGIAVDISIMSGPFSIKDFENIVSGSDISKGGQINQYHLKEKSPSDKKAVSFLKEVMAIVNKENYNNSDVMTDYFDVGFYTHFALGKYEKPYKEVA